ncbi:MAG TPA: HigA family addiction module antitoxin [Dongiaceae bacterium]|nr:HigA family addiction module antitoxin [Dongiaceae bacterium]
MRRHINRLRPIHPGQILAEELRELGLTARAFAGALKVPHNRISAILNGQRGISADTALRLAAYFRTEP